MSANEIFVDEMSTNEMSVDEMFFRENDMMLYWYTTETVICMKIFILEWLLKTVIHKLLTNFLRLWCLFPGVIASFKRAFMS